MKKRTQPMLSNKELPCFCFIFQCKEALPVLEVLKSGMRWCNQSSEVSGKQSWDYGSSSMLKSSCPQSLPGPEGTEHCLKSHDCSCNCRTKARVKNNHVTQNMLTVLVLDITRSPLLMTSHPHQSAEERTMWWFGMW